MWANHDWVDIHPYVKGEEQRFVFKLFPPEEQDENFIVPLVFAILVVAGINEDNHNTKF